LKTNLKYEYLDDIENNFFSISSFKSWCYKAYEKYLKRNYLKIIIIKHFKIIKKIITIFGI